ncbi:MAG: hypothetical protein D6818_06090, partial [Bacteroidetes bacterium]
MAGDSSQHLLMVRDQTDTSCLAQTTFVTPLCVVSQPCALSLNATQTAGCNADNEVEVTLELASSFAGSGFYVSVDGNTYNATPWPYDADGLTTVPILLSGNGSVRTIVVTDADSVMCTATDTVLVSSCGPPCLVEQVEVHTGSSRHYVEVKDFEFVPAQLEVIAGDTVTFYWTGAIEHTTTSDATSGPDSWDSGLLGQGATYDVVIHEAGDHPYYCIPHGGPGGIGMAGVIHALPPCTDSLMANVHLSFEVTSGSSQGFNVFLDGQQIAGPLSYTQPQGRNDLIVQVPGDGDSHALTVQDLETSFCAATTFFTAPDCSGPCQILDLQAHVGADIVHVVEVQDFEFVPAVLSVRTGETIRFEWTGAIPHSTTSDATTGPDAWNSGILPQGSTYELVLSQPGTHPYYCIPHGGPGGIGMAGVIEAQPACDSGLVTVQLTFGVTDGSPAGYRIYLDGVLLPGGPFAYDDPMGTNTAFVQIPGDGQLHFLTVQDVETAFCAATVQVQAPDCGAPCAISGLSVALSQNTTHIVEVKDFEFVPKNLDIALGDTVRFVWTGAIEHTTTSDATSGPDVWDSGLLGTGATYELVLTTPGNHPYYCIPHGGPGGIGMAGTISVTDPCADGMVAGTLTFATQATGSSYLLWVDGQADAGNPHPYTGNGQESLPLSLPADGQTHQIVVQDASESACADTLWLTTPACYFSCSLSANVASVSACDSLDQVTLTFELAATHGGSGLWLTVDGQQAGPWPYDSTGHALVEWTLEGDGLAHTFVFADADSAGCSDTLVWQAPDCTPPCSMQLHAVQAGGCNAALEVPFEVEAVATNTTATQWRLFADGSEVAGSPFDIGSGPQPVWLPGDGQSHVLVAQAVGDDPCTDTLWVATPQCSEPCQLFDFGHELNVPTVHVVKVLDFTFEPKVLTVTTGDVVRWVWEGVVPHTTTSDAVSGPDVWNSGLLGQGSVYEVTITEAGAHPYYCIPHGAPGGIGMAGTIIAEAPCDDGLLTLSVSFRNENTGQAGFIIEAGGIALPGTPFSYDSTGFNTVTFAWPGNG